MTICTIERPAVCDIDDLDLTGAVVGLDYIVLISEEVTLYHRHGRRVELVGTYAGPAEAMDALDRLDAAC